jgi:hypothetical protein
VGRGQRHAVVHSGFVVRRRLSPNQLLNQIKQGRLFAPRASEQRTHGNGGIDCRSHVKTSHTNFIESD